MSSLPSALVVSLLIVLPGCTLLFGESSEGNPDDSGVFDAGGSDATIDLAWQPEIGWVTDTHSLFGAHLVQGENPDTAIIIGSFSGELRTSVDSLSSNNTSQIGFVTIDLSDGKTSTPNQIGTVGTLYTRRVSRSKDGYFSMTGQYEGLENFCPQNPNDCEETATSPARNAFVANYGETLPNGIAVPTTVTILGAEDVNGAGAAQVNTLANDSLALTNGHTLMIGSFVRDIRAELTLPADKDIKDFNNPIEKMPMMVNTHLYLLRHNRDGNMDKSLTIRSSEENLIPARSVGWSIEEDPSSTDIYIAGTFKGNFQLDESSTDLSSSTNALFVSKLSSNFDTIRWSFSYGSNVSDSPIFTRMLGDGSMLIAGAFTDNFDIPGFPLSAAQNEKRVFLLKINKDGAVQWATSYGQRGKSVPSGLVVANDNEIYLGGNFNPSEDDTDGFVLRLDQQGKVIGQFLTPGPGMDSIVNLDVTTAGTLIVSLFTAGQFKLNGTGPELLASRYIFELDWTQAN